MSDESFFREVSEELRQDRLKSIWTRFGTAIIAVVVVIILATAAFVGWERYSVAQANQSGDRYLAAQDLVTDGDIDGAITAFRDLAEDGWGAYPELARMSIGNAYANDGRTEEAIATYDEVAGDSSVPTAMREMADLRSAYLMVDAGSLADVRGKAERMTGDDNPLRYAARDAIALSAWTNGETETARDLYQSIVDAGDAPQGINQRAQLILGLMSAGEDVENPASVGAAATSVPASAGSAPADAQNGQAGLPEPNSVQPAASEGSETPSATETPSGDAEGSGEARTPASDPAATSTGDAETQPADGSASNADANDGAESPSAPAATSDAGRAGIAVPSTDGATNENAGGAESSETGARDAPNTAPTDDAASDEAEAATPAQNPTEEPETLILPEPASDETPAGTN